MKVVCVICGKQTEQGGYTARIKGQILRPVCEDCQRLCSTYPDQVLWENPALFASFTPGQQPVDSPRRNLSKEVLEWRDTLRKMLLKNGITQPPRRVLAGRIFLGLAVTLWVFGLLFQFYSIYRQSTAEEYHSYYYDSRDLYRAERDFIFAIVYFLVMVGSPVYIYLSNRGRRTLAPDAFAELDRLPDRRPVLFLRSFKRQPSHRAIFKAGDWFELAVVKELREKWPVIAIGKPGERIPPMGAGRFYVPKAHWQETVLWFLSECPLILLVYSSTPGVLWELSSIVERLDPSKLIICIPRERKFLQKKIFAWLDFKERTRGIFPMPLPDNPGRALFLRFDASWNPVLVASPSRVSLSRSRAVRTALRAALMRET